MRKCAKVQPVPFHLLLLGVTAIKEERNEKRRKKKENRKRKEHSAHMRALIRIIETDCATYAGAEQVAG